MIALRLLLLLAVIAGPARAGLPLDGFTLGQGLTLPGGLWVAGDVTVGGEAPRDDVASVELDDVSLLARWQPLPRLAFFTEVRWGDVLEAIEGERPSSSGNTFRLERLWVEGVVTPELSVRVGQTFTPFGIWNQTFRAPLTWTIEEPAITDDVVPIHATGLSLIYRTTRSGWSIDGTAYGPIQDGIRFGEESELGWLMGGRLAVGHSVGPGFATVGLNGAAFRRYDRRSWIAATGLDLELTTGEHQITSELTFRIPTDGRRAAYGFYLQDAFPLRPIAPDLFGVVRFEAIQPSQGPGAVGGAVGLFWRPVPWLVLRADYLFANRSLERLTPGIHGSVSLLF